MKLSEFEALSFDCYGTLIDWEAGLSVVLEPWARERGLDVAGERLLGEFAAVESDQRQVPTPRARLKRCLIQVEMSG